MAEQFTRIGYMELEISNETNLGPLAQAILDAYNNNTTFTLELLGRQYGSDIDEVLSIPNRTVVKEGNAYFIDLSDINNAPEGKPKPGIRMIEREEEESPVALASTNNTGGGPLRIVGVTTEYWVLLMGYANFEGSDDGGEIN